MYYVDDLILGHPVSFETLHAAEHYAQRYGWEILPESTIPVAHRTPLNNAERYYHG